MTVRILVSYYHAFGSIGVRSIMTLMNTQRTLRFIVSITIPLLAGYIGSVFTTPALPIWYNALVKPALTPPSLVFAPVWTSLFLLMGVAFFLVWSTGAGSTKSKRAMGMFLFQLVVNMLWSVAFFGLQSPLLGLVVISILWLSILCTMRSFYPISKTSTYLLLPYILWVSFASYLNYAIWTLN